MDDLKEYAESQYSDEAFDEYITNAKATLAGPERDAMLYEAEETLFGEGHILKPERMISQPGQFVSTDRVSLVGPKGTLHNVAVLGPVRAYTQAAQAALAVAQTGQMVYSQKLTLEVAYNQINNVQYYLAQNNINIADSRYEANVQFDISLPEAEVKRITDGLTQKCEGQISIAMGDKGYYLM